jgi:oxygen-independent coproporphyrinogen-3 oxidase
VLRGQRERAADWDATLGGALALAPEHVSAYALTVEPGTPLGRAVAAGERRAPDDDVQAARYERADDVLTAAGFEWYEVSNWARPGEVCRHNLLYWEGGDYLAIGCAAHGHTAGRRWWNVRTPERYVEAVEQGRSPEAGEETLGHDEAGDEALLLALRTRGGIKLPEPTADCHAVDACIEELVGSGLVARDAGRATLTRTGRLLANEVATRLLLAREADRGGPQRLTNALALGTIECQ